MWMSKTGMVGQTGHWTIHPWVGGWVVLPQQVAVMPVAGVSPHSDMPG